MLSIATTVLKNFRSGFIPKNIFEHRLKRHAKYVPQVWEIEVLEDRSLLSATAIVFDAPHEAHLEVQPFIVAGDPNGTPSDSPSARIDANTTTSPYAGVGSIFVETVSGGYICTGTVIDNNHVGTAAHCVDINGDGDSDEITRVRFVLNYGGDLTHIIDASTWVVHPDWTGFNNPSVNDDLAILTLDTNVPAGVPVYSMFTGDPTGQSGILVGYGTTGDPVGGFISGSADFAIKRVGENTMGVVGDFAALGIKAQDDSGGPNIDEVWVGDFDHYDSTSSTADVLGDGLSIGNDRETTLGGGDSGGPFFFEVGGELQWAGINTFGTTNAPAFGSLLGGMNVSAYSSWISDQLGDPPPGDDPPEVAITSPSNRAKISATVTVAALATDDLGVTGVEFFASGVSIGSGTDVGGGNWTIDWDTTTVEDGRYNLTAEATDTGSQTTESSSIRVTVKNGGGGGGGGKGGGKGGGGGRGGRSTEVYDIPSQLGTNSTVEMFFVIERTVFETTETLKIAEIREATSQPVVTTLDDEEETLKTLEFDFSYGSSISENLEDREADTETIDALFELLLGKDAKYELILF